MPPDRSTEYLTSDAERGARPDALTTAGDAAYLLGGTVSVAADDALWERLVDPPTLPAYLESWLVLQCRQLGGVRKGLLLLGPPEVGPFTPAALWPPGESDLEHLGSTAERVLVERRPLVAPPPTDSERDTLHLAYPVEIRSRLHGAVVLEIATCPPGERQARLRTLHWGVAALEALFLRRAADEDEAVKQRILYLVDLTAITVDQPGFRGACTALATALASRLECDRASIGFISRGRARLQALSHSASFGEQMNLVRALEAAMDEATEQGCVVEYPAAAGDTRITRAHEELARQQRASSVGTAPVRAAGEAVGAITLEAGAADRFPPDTMELLEALAAMVGPILELKRREDRWVSTKVALAARDQLGKLVGPRYVARKLALIVLLASGAALSVANGGYRVTAQATIQGSIRHSAVAPRDGYIADAWVRAGDIVREGDRLSALDDRELELEHLKASTLRAQLVNEHRDAVAKHARAEANILDARIRQADAQIVLLDTQLARSTLRAPFEAIVVAGDLSQSLGSPVERGRVLFELAPLSQYRVELGVDERDASDLRVGQSGELVLAALPGERFGFRVARITPIAVTREGRNVLRLEAELADAAASLRPGMEGVAKIDIGERKLAWIWTHGLLQRLRLWAWRWLP